MSEPWSCRTESTATRARPTLTSQTPARRPFSGRAQACATGMVKSAYSFPSKFLCRKGDPSPMAPSSTRRRWAFIKCHPTTTPIDCIVCCGHGPSPRRTGCRGYPGVAWTAAGASADTATEWDGEGAVGWDPRWLHIDVTDAVEDMSVGRRANLGWRLVPVAGNTNSKRFQSSEALDAPGRRPRIIIEYSPPAADPAYVRAPRH